MGEERRAWMGDVWRRGEKMKVFWAEVARWMRSIAAVGEVADLERARKGCRGVC